MAAAAGSVTILPNPPLRLRCAAVVAARRSGNKHAHRLLSSLVRADPAGVDRLIRKFVAGSSKQTALEALSHLMSLPQHPAFAIRMYQTIAETPWFRWSPAPAAAAAALLEKTGRLSEAEALIHESASAERSSRETELFYCALMEQAARQGLVSRVSSTRVLLQNKTGAAGRRARESVVRALCLLGRPQEAEAAASEHRPGSQPSVFEMRVVAQAFGKLGLFEDMERVIATATATPKEGRGFDLDTVTANVAISCYGERRMFRDIVSWLQRMRKARTPVSIRTFNVVLNACPTISAMVREERGVGPGLPTSLTDMAEALRGCDEADVLAELTDAPVAEAVLLQAAKWEESEWKLDMHGFHAGAALVMFMIWVDELRRRVVTTELGKEVVVVCGAGKHSDVRGESPVRTVVGRLAAAMKSPFRVDRKNTGRFVAKGKAVVYWLLGC